MTLEAVFEARGVGKAYRIYRRPADRLKQMVWGRFLRQGYGTEFWALHPLDLVVHRGESFGIVGRNGSGKSTLLQLAAGILSPTCGEVMVRGRVAALLELGSGFNPEYTGQENVYLNAMVLGLSRAEIDARYERIVAFADIGEFIDRPVKLYSSGMYVRLAFAVAIHVDPEILIVDEALAVGDIGFVGKCLQAVDDFRRRGGTLIVVSHDMGMIKNLTQRAVLLDSGRSRYLGDAVATADLYLSSLGGAAEQAAPGTFLADGAAAGITSVAFSVPATSGGQRHIDVDVEAALAIRCDLAVGRPTELDFNISLYDGTRRIVAAERSRLSLTGPGQASVSVSIERLLLVPGTYSVNVSLREAGSMAYMSWIRDACSVTIRGNEAIPRVYRQPMRVSLKDAGS